MNICGHNLMNTSISSLCARCVSPCSAPRSTWHHDLPPVCELDCSRSSRELSHVALSSRDWLVALSAVSLGSVPLWTSVSFLPPGTQQASGQFPPSGDRDCCCYKQMFTEYDSQRLSYLLLGNSYLSQKSKSVRTQRSAVTTWSD